MRNVIFTGIGILGLALVLPSGLAAQDKDMKGMHMEMPKGKDVKITGMVVDVSCKFGQGLQGEGHRMCAQVCADRGLPLAILTDDGKLYIPTSAGMPGDAQNGRLKDFAEHRVTVEGKAFAAGGAQAIQIATINAAT
ncbi:MAG: hypothetical protein SGJ01_08745 [Gemmatimonadota bacterium]|nr:hypothetical protein [Gemmatimonadota bacterium]